MTLPASEQPFNDLWSRAIIGTIIGVLIGTLNRDIGAAIFGASMPARLAGYAFGGIVAGAVQGAFLRHYTQPKWVWLGVSAIGWMLIGLPDIWFPDFPYWLCDQLGRWMVSGAISGACVGLIQSAALWRYPSLLKGWALLNIALWAGIWMLPVMIFGSLLRGEGTCL